MIELKNLTEDNIRAVLDLKVLDNQKTYVDVGGNAAALSYSYLWTLEKKINTSLVIYFGEEVIGLILYLYEIVDDEEYFKELPCFGQVTC